MSVPCTDIWLLQDSKIKFFEPLIFHLYCKLQDLCFFLQMNEDKRRKKQVYNLQSRYQLFNKWIVLSIYLSIYLSVCLSVCLSISQSINHQGVKRLIPIYEQPRRDFNLSTQWNQSCNYFYVVVWFPGILYFLSACFLHELLLQVVFSAILVKDLLNPFL